MLTTISTMQVTLCLRRSSNSQPLQCNLFLFKMSSTPLRLCPTCFPWRKPVIDPRWGTQDGGPIRPLCGEWTQVPFIIPFQLKPSKKWLNNQLQANGAIYPCYGRTLVIGLGMSGQCQMSYSNAKRVRQMIKSGRRGETGEKQRKRNTHLAVTEYK